jgi:hypothetical protein
MPSVTSYRTIPVAVDAAQFFKASKPWPRGVVMHAWNTGPGDNESDLPSVDQGKWPNRDWMWLQDGDWVVRWPSGALEVVSNEAFVRRFEVAEVSNAEDT